MRAVVQALMLEHGLLYVLRAEKNPFSKRLRVDPFAFRLSAFKVFGGAFGLFGDLGRQNVSHFIGRALCNWGGFVGFDWGNRFSWSFCGRALGRAVLNDDAETFVRSFVRSGGQSVSRAVLIEYARAGRLSKAMKWMRRRCSWLSRVSCASARKLFFSSARRGWGSERGRGLA